MTTSTVLESMPSRHFVKPQAYEAGNCMSSKDFGERVLQARLRLSVLLRRKLSQSDLAEMLGVAQPTYGRWENGVKEPQDLATWERLAAVLRVNPEWLAFGRGKMEPEETAAQGEGPRVEPTFGVTETKAAEEALKRQSAKKGAARKKREA